MPRRRTTALPVLAVPTGADPLISAVDAAAQIGISANRFWAYWKRFPLLVSGRRVTEATEGGKGRSRWIQSYVTAHIHTEMRNGRDELAPRAAAPQLATTGAASATGAA